PGKEVLEEGPALLDPSLRQVGVHPADPEVDVVEPAAGDLLEEVQDHLALAETPEEHGGRPEVDRPGAQPDEMAGDPVQLGEDHPDIPGPHAGLDAGEPLDRQAVDLLVVE